jgi:protein O-GlcNAc transferase
VYIFVSGFGHGGTSLMASILGSHPDTHLIPYETRWFLTEKLSDRELKEYAKNIDKPYIIEKTPMHVRKIRGISELFPDSHFVIMVRNPLDVVASQYKRHGDIHKAISRCQEDYDAIANVKSMGHVHIVRYEDLVSNTESVIRGICGDVGLLFRAEMLRFYEKPRMFLDVDAKQTDGVGEEEHLKRRAWQIQQPIFDGSGRWRSELNSDQIGAIQDCLKKIFSFFCYNSI